MSVPGDTTRPILDRVKTALFDVLRPKLEGAKVLDAFAGSGSVGIEALSQGALHCTFLDIEPKATETIRDNLERTGLSEHAEVRTIDSFRYIRNTNKVFDLIYIAPPQYKGIWSEAMRTICERPEVVSEEGLIVVQIDPKEEENLEFNHFCVQDRRKYGNTLLVFYQRT